MCSRTAAVVFGRARAGGVSSGACVLGTAGCCGVVAARTAVQ
jgi:hypothetical protein